jgi:hypothetical protein
MHRLTREAIIKMQSACQIRPRPFWQHFVAFRSRKCTECFQVFCTPAKKGETFLKESAEPEVEASVVLSHV